MAALTVFFQSGTLTGRTNWKRDKRVSRETGTERTNLLRMQVCDSDWKAVKVTAAQQGTAAQHVAGAAIARVVESSDADLVQQASNHPACESNTRRSVWVAMPRDASIELDRLRERTGLSWSRLLYIALAMAKAGDAA